MSRTKSGYKAIHAKLNGVVVPGVGELSVVKYYEGKRAAIQIEGGAYGVLTVNIPECPLDESNGEILVKTWSENERFSKKMMETGLFEDTGRRFPAGFCEAQVWRVKI